MKDPNSPLSKRSIFFGYDSFIVEEPYRGIVEAHARMLLDNPNVRIMLQGNTDERGSREYNLALGQRRSDAVRKMMGVLGVPDRQIETVSLGEEKPARLDTTRKHGAKTAVRISSIRTSSDA